MMDKNSDGKLSKKEFREVVALFLDSNGVK